MKAPQKRKVHPLGKRLKDDKGKLMAPVPPDGIVPPKTTSSATEAAKNRHAKPTDELMSQEDKPK